MSRKPRVLVTGAEGFVGIWLLRALASDLREWEVVTAGRGGKALGSSEDESAILLDITDREEVMRVVASVRPAGVVHLAAISSVAAARRDRWLTWAVNAGGTLNLAEAVREKAPGARFVFASSAEVYGSTFANREDPIDETAPLDPVNPYAASKAAADLMLGEMARDGLEAVRMRPFNHTGPGQGEAFVVSAFASQIARIEAGLAPPVLRTGNLDVSRDFLDVRDVVQGYVRALSAPDVEPGRIYNLASGKPVKIRAMVERLLAMSHVEIGVETDRQLLRPTDTPITIGSFDRARAELGWHPAIPFERTLSDVLADSRARVRRIAST